MRFRIPLLTLTALLAAAPGLRADEGMWTFDNLPVQKLQAKYGFSADQAWLDHLRLSSLRFPGGSGSFISPDGLVLTNHHVGRSHIQTVSTPEHDYVKDGFVALTRAEELKIPGLELNTLMSMDNVTAQVNKAAAGLSDKDALKAREVELGRLQKELQDRTGLTAEPVVLYQGGEYWLYAYKKHTDVRLVMAPEMGIAFFGGDSDNFTYPRHNLDFSMFRVYENGQPYHPPQYLKVTRTGVKAGDLTFVTGHPAATMRLETYAQMLASRDFEQPERIRGMERLKRVYEDFASQSPEHARQANSMMFRIENSIKARTGYLSGLKNPEAMARIEQAERELRAKVAADPALQAKVGGSWDAIQGALAARKTLFAQANCLDFRDSSLMGFGLTLVQLAEEGPKPSAERLKPFVDANLPALKKRLQVKLPFFPELETALLAHDLEEARTALGAGHPFVKAVLGGKSPAEVAQAAVAGSRLSDPAVRRALMDGGLMAILGSEDPMVLLARQLDGPSREIHKAMENQVTSVLTEHGGRIARARFDAYGKSVYPDATFTLRMTYGPVASYAANGTHVQPFTTFHGLFDRADGWGPEAEHGAWALPKRWVEAKGRLNLDTPFDFIHAVDIIGGNSGSPVVDRKGELIGLIFDGNIESLPGAYFYDGAVNRGVAVDARAILEALDKVYDDQPILREIRGQ